MPERRPRPIYANRQSDFDEPPASDDIVPRSRRREFIHRARGLIQFERRRLRANEQWNASIDNEFMARPPSRDPVTSAHPGSRQRSRRTASPEEEDDQHDAGHSPNNGTSRRSLDYLRERMTKRRRLDPDVLPISCPPIKYGHYGQVEPGRLKMCLISCDGGQHTDIRSPNIDLGPHNVLRMDKSVYSSERNAISMVLRHADDTPFSLTQLSVIAPEHGFTAPVRMGVAWVAMTLQTLEKYTTKPSESSCPEDRPPPYVEASEQAQDTTADDDPSFEHTSASPRSQDRSSVEEDESHYLLASDTPATLASDTDLGPEDVSSQEVLDYRLQRMRQLQRRQEGMRWRDRRLNRSLPLNDDFSAFTGAPDSQDDASNVETRPQYRRYRPDMLSHLFPSATGQDETREIQQQPSPQPTQEKLWRKSKFPYHGDDPDVNFVSFRISQESHKVTMKFKTPVSGRFILLKLGAETGADNVDVQSIILTGYAGPRFFPATQPR